MVATSPTPGSAAARGPPTPYRPRRAPPHAVDVLVSGPVLDVGHGQGERGGTMKAAETPWAILSTMIQVSAMEVVVVAPHNADETARSTTPALKT